MRKKEIPKDGGNKVRVLSIPAIRDRVVQGALKLILEPIFDADFQPGSYGYRPQRTAQQAVLHVEGIVLAVGDNGAGISPSVMKEIFEAFFTTKGLAGTGLGL